MIRILLIILGTIALMLSIIGLVLPLLPTTPLVLVAAACYARSSIRFHRWMTTNRYFGQTIVNWEKTKSITVKARTVSLLMLNFSMLLSCIIIYPNTLGLVFLIITAVIVNIIICRIPTN